MNRVEAIRPVHESEVILKKDASELEDWYFDQYGIYEMHRQKLFGQNQKIGIIDTGVPRHDDITVYIGEDARNGFNPIKGDSKIDIDGHATHVGGILCADHNGFGTKGLVPLSMPHFVKALNDNGSGTIGDIIRAGDRLVELGVVACNMSLGMNTKDKDLDYAIQRWYAKGMICFCAGGNDGKRHDLDFPGSHPLTISVASHDRNGRRSKFTDSGDMLDIYAPGEQIISTVGTSDYAVMSGSSQATPVAMGIFVAYRQALLDTYGTITIEMISDLLTDHEI